MLYAVLFSSALDEWCWLTLSACFYWYCQDDSPSRLLLSTSRVTPYSLNEGSFPTIYTTFRVCNVDWSLFLACKKAAGVWGE